MTAGLSSPSHAATGWDYIATAGGTFVQAADAAVSSDLTAQSAVTGGPAGQSSRNSTAGVNAAGLLAAGAIETSTSSAAVPDGVKVTSNGQTARVNLLSGLITADAVRTTISTTGTGSGTSTEGGTEFVNLKIVGVQLPVNIPKNYTVNVPGVATISLNGHISAEAPGGRVTQGWAIGINLLQARDGAPAGARVFVNPVYQAVKAVPPSTGATIAGTAYGTRVEAAAGSSVQVYSHATANIDTPFGSSNGETLRNATAAVNVPGVVTTGAIESTTTSSKSGTSDAQIVNTNELARLNVLGGVVTADAIKVTATGKRTNGAYQGSMNMTLVNLKVAGQTIPIDVSPNTKITVAGLGEVIINQQVQNGGANLVRAVYIKLSTAQAGLPVGAEIEVGVAYTAIL